MTTATKEPQILDASVAQPVRYCVDLWLRDEQIKVNTARVKGRIEGWEGDAPRPGPVAIACFGPSLNDTWEQLKGFETIISCSGAHKFLIERGVIPAYHVEVDPRAHKVKLIGQPHQDVEYLIASTCHPDVLDHLAGYNVKLWHVFDNQEDAKRTLPHGEWALTGGSSVGLRSMTIARFLGFTDLHVFGMDGNQGTSGKHAAEHPSQPKGHAITVYDGVTYKTTASMLECARQTWHELDQMPGVTAKFYGEGLVQHMAKHYVPKPIPVETAAIGSLKPRLISAEYVALNAQLHKDNLAYGVGGGKHADTVLKLADSLQTRSILDYGAGKGYLAKAIPFPIWEYDPAIPGKQESPRPADLVVCTDVLEHVEPSLLPFVLDDLRRCVKQIGYFTISTRAAVKVLSDGRNAHLIQEGKQWWRTTLQQFFLVGKIIDKGSELHVIVAPKAGR
jgi:uncharacterized Rossmann fold enzyme